MRATGNYCPVCGYEGPEGSRAPYIGDEPSFDICPCCGFQYGVTDDIEQETFESWRLKWVESGAKWDADAQLQNIGLTLEGERRRVLEERALSLQRSALDDPEKFQNLVLSRFQWLPESGFRLVRSTPFRLFIESGSAQVFIMRHIGTGQLSLRLGHPRMYVALESLLRARNMKIAWPHGEDEPVPKTADELAQLLQLMSRDLASVIGEVLDSSSSAFERACELERD